jgi:hypothetical protein
MLKKTDKGEVVFLFINTFFVPVTVVICRFIPDTILRDCAMVAGG